MKFTKMHGIGNDYVYVNCFEENVKDPAETARFVSDRHFGIGSDGLILIRPSDVADCEMDMYNLDGSRGAMCGNGIRCVAKYAYDHGIVHKDRITVATGAGIKTLDLTVQDGRVSRVRVNMGSPVFAPARIPVDLSCLAADAPEECRQAEARQRIVDLPYMVDGVQRRFTAVSMGNPHAVVFAGDPGALDLERIGPAFENHPCFPDRVNTEFIAKVDDHSIRMRVWERGSGETLACGTGACAAAVASILNGVVSPDGPVTVHLLGGDLVIEWDRDEDTVYMTGPAEEVFSGEILLPDFG